MPHRGPCVAKLTLNYRCQVRRKVFNKVFNSAMWAHRGRASRELAGVHGAACCVGVNPARGHTMSATGRPVFRPRRRYCLLAAALCAAVLTSQPSHAEKRSGAVVPNKPALGPAGERLNANTIAIISGNLNATYVTIAYDLSAVLDDGDEFRVLPQQQAQPASLSSATSCSRSS